MNIIQMSIGAGLPAVVAKATLLLCIGWCGALMLRRAPAGARHLVWLAVIVGVLLLPALNRMVPLHVALLSSTPVATVSAPSVMSVSLNTQALASRAAPSFVAPNYGAIAVALWLGVTVLLLGWLIAGMLSVRAILRSARPLESVEWTGILRDAARRLDLVVVPRLVMSDRVNMAFACSALAPTIVLPASAGEWTEDRRQAVLLHELAHVRRRDLIGHLVSRTACAVYWFHPLVWIAARRLRAESELACDDLVLVNGMRPSDYAQHLLDMVTTLGHQAGAPLAAMPMVRRSEFEGRLVAILNRAQRRSALGRVHLSALISVLAFSIVSIGMVAPVAARQSGSAAHPTTDRHGTIIAPRPLLGSVVDTPPPPTPRRPVATAPRQRYDILVPYVPISDDSARVLRRFLQAVARAAFDTSAGKLRRPDTAQHRPE